MLSGVSPCAICQASVPLFISSAVMRPYGGLMIGNPCTLGPPPPPSPPPPPRPPPAAAPRPPPAACGTGEPASVSAGAPPRPPSPEPVEGPRPALGTALGSRADP